jgi:hypothetical protein
MALHVPVVGEGPVLQILGVFADNFTDAPCKLAAGCVEPAGVAELGDAKVYESTSP